MKLQILIFIVFIQGIIVAQNFWQSSGSLNGAYKYAMIYTKSGVLLVGSGERIYKYNGINFQQMSFMGHGDVHALAVDPKNGYLYAGMESYHETLGGVYISYDDGNNWTAAGLSGKGISDIVVDSGGIVIASVYSDNNTGYLFRSTNSGNTWSTLFNNSNYAIFCVAKDAKNNIYTGIQNPNNSTEAILFKSSDRGETWQVVKIFTGSENKVRGIGIDTSGNNILVHTQSGGKVYLSTDSGSAWAEILSGLEYFDKVPFIVNKFNYVFVGSYGGGVYRSTNGGIDWEQLNSGLSDLLILSFAVKDNDIFCGTHSNVFYGQINQPPSPPYLLTPSNESVISTLSPSFDWEDVQNVTSYRVQISKDSLFSIIVLDTNSIQQSNLTLPSNRLANNTKYFWRTNASNNAGEGSWSKIWSFTIQAPTDINGRPSSVPNLYMLSQNYPNPFNPTTMINYQLPIAGYVTLKVYDMLGVEVAVIVNEYKTQGYYNIKFDGSGLPNGIYLYRLLSGNFSLTKKFVLLK
ncbi:MAG: T9SS type A sorting domain-containing protein [Ignavibacteria bacterium]|nr:T9SS type A sorting domain-containing protein [Ignavibacteria bacterium]